jgi:hypothetical protein
VVCVERILDVQRPLEVPSRLTMRVDSARKFGRALAVRNRFRQVGLIR